MNWKNILEADFTLSAQQLAHFEALDGLYREWNAQINVISRKDIDALYEHHVLHSLAIARPGADFQGFRWPFCFHRPGLRFVIQLARKPLWLRRLVPRWSCRTCK